MPLVHGRYMARVDQTEILTRMVVDNPVPSVLHSVQSKEGHPLDPKCFRGREFQRSVYTWQPDPGG